MDQESKANKGDHKVTKAAKRAKANAKAPRGKPARPAGGTAKRSSAARNTARVRS